MANPPANLAVARVAHAQRAGRRLAQACRSRVVHGTFVIEVPTTRTLQMLALAGFEFVVVDLEHSSLGFEGVEPILTSATAVDLPVLVRVWSPEPGLIGKVLDLGPAGIMVPHVENEAQARQAVAATRYPPRGGRSVVPLTPYEHGGLTIAERDESVLLVLQVEGPQGLEECGAIAGVAGVDALFIGVFDLAAALPGNVSIDGPEIRQAARLIRREVQDAVLLGVYVHDPAYSHRWGKLGYYMQCVSFDGAMLYRGASQALTIAAEPQVPRRETDPVMWGTHDTPEVRSEARPAPASWHGSSESFEGS